jgi:hypothetical protein
MNAPTFDMLHAAKRLRESGFEDAQAEAVVATVNDAITGGVASKADLAELRAEFKSDIYKQLWIVAAFVVSAVVAAIKFLP